MGMTKKWLIGLAIAFCGIIILVTQVACSKSDSTKWIGDDIDEQINVDTSYQPDYVFDTNTPIAGKYVNQTINDENKVSYQEYANKSEYRYLEFKFDLTMDNGLIGSMPYEKTIMTALELTDSITMQLYVYDNPNDADNHIIGEINQNNINLATCDFGVVHSYIKVWHWNIAFDKATSQYSLSITSDEQEVSTTIALSDYSTIKLTTTPRASAYNYSGNLSNVTGKLILKN